MKKDRRKAVTLLSLVITVIVLIILAGITISLTIGEQGIFKHGQEAKVKQEIAQYIDKIELARGEATLDKKRRPTLDELIEKIKQNDVIPGGRITKLDEEKAGVVTKEGYVIIITQDGTKYDRTENVEEMPELKEGNIVISVQPQEEWINTDVTVTIQNNVQGNFTLKYSLDEKNWITYTAPFKVSKNTNVYACLENVVGEQGNHTSLEISKIDKLDPVQFIPTVTNTTNTITISAVGAQDAEASGGYAKSGIGEIWYKCYKKGEAGQWKTNEDKTKTDYTFTGLDDSEIYIVEVKVIDKAKNEITTVPQEINTDEIQIAEGNIIIKEPIWDATTHKASVEIEKGSSVASTLQIQYQVNGDNENSWTTGTSVGNLNHGDVVNARLWDENNGGSYTSLTVVDSKIPQEAQIKFNSTNIKIGQSTNANIKLADNESGINISECRWSFVDSSETIGTDGSKYEKEFEEETNEQTISVSSADAGTYYLHVLSVDEAGNKIEKVSEPVEITYLYVGEKLKVGDYIRYDVGSQSYTVETAKSGAAEQNFNTNTYTGLWRVLYNDSTNGLQLVSADPVIDLKIKGKNGYNNLVSTLNTVASKYINTAYASKARALGSNVTTPEGISAIYSNSEYSYIKTLANDMIIADTNYTADYNVMSSNNMANIGKEYWMASRYIYTDENGAGFNAVVTDEQG